jgi:hypothetical protein
MAGDISRLTWTVRALALVCALTLVVAVVEASALRRQRGDVQRLLDERARVVAGQHDVWARLAAPEFARAIAALHAYYIDAAAGLRRPKGLVLDDGDIDADAVARWVLGVYAPARAAGQSHDAAVAAMEAAVRESPEYKAAHPAIR